MTACYETYKYKSVSDVLRQWFEKIIKMQIIIRRDKLL